MKIVILERNSVGEDISVDCFQDFGEVVAYPNTAPGDVAGRIGDADIVIVNKSILNEGTLKNASNLKLICELATGYDNIDIKYCRARGIQVTNVKNYSTASVAQHTLALALYLAESLKAYDTYVKDGSYGAQDKFCNFDFPFTELEGKVWGIIGMGNIGKSVARIASALGCRVIFHSVTGKSTCTEYEQVSFEELLKQSDVLSLHCPLSDLTRHLIDKEALSKMKKTAILINVARGPVVNSRDLYDALENGTIAAAGVDVLEREPIADSDPLGRIKDSSRLIITPHMAWASGEARTRLVGEVYKNVQAFLNGEKRNVVI